MLWETFQMERMQSTWENRVDYNLSESGVHPLSLREFLSENQIRELESLELGYPQSNGTEELRRNIARRYPNAGPDNILVTSGGSEANFLSVCRLVERGDQISMILPNYMQMWGLGRSLQAQVNPLWMRRDSSGWRLDLDLLRKLPATTRALIVCNPNNPTGATLNEEEMNAIVEAAERAQAYLICDEIYCGAEHDADSHSRTPSFWGRYPKVIITNGLSKAYGLPGLRIGWIATTVELAEQLWSYHDYTTISMSMLSERIAAIVLSANVEPKILERTRKIIRDN
ncbi:MAG TPA: aminotransferase class I/II-fold pyridoxal phosphate-dependent enzyme, partial [Acidobacteriota bacterium]